MRKKNINFNFTTLHLYVVYHWTYHIIRYVGYFKLINSLYIQFINCLSKLTLKKYLETFFLLKLRHFFQRDRNITSTFVSKYPGISSKDFLSVILLLYNLLFSLLISDFSPSIEGDRNWLRSLLQFTNRRSEYYD